MPAKLLTALLLLLTTLAIASSDNESASVDSTLSDQTLFSHQNPVLNTSVETITTHPNTDGCAAACAHLLTTSIALSNPNTTAYLTSRSAYWSSFQSSQSPACFAHPATALEVSLLLTVAKRFGCPFALKSGGHAAFPGASNIASGLVISLDKLRTLEISADRSVTRVGTGNKWIDVYEYLQPRGLSVVGGRVPDIGTGGLVLGGGISFFSGRYGWACDGVRTYEVVVADGAVLEVSRDEFPDLYWALRGGGNNLGVVTRVDLETFPQGSMWGGSTTVVVDQSSRTALMAAMEAFARRAPEDVDAAAYTAWVWVRAQGAWIAVNELTHAGGVAYPEVLKGFTDVPAVGSTLRMTELTDLVQELGKMNVNGLRESFMTHAFKMSVGMMGACLDVFVEEIEAIKEVGGILPVLLFQPIPTSMIKQFSRNGGNCLGIDADEGPLLLMSTSTWWVDTSQDELVLATMKSVIDRSVQKAKETGEFHPYIYQNYAGQEQEVFAGYGKKNLARLRGIAKRYDSEGVFQQLQPGYFKLGGSE